ncbi:Ankyrin repeat domain-containing 34B [Paramuricea clavata]|uniref:Ankyrin repeat domain-containing 34B n=1 Tax=Paramuricea clavata TaxID=317549 RepID=A0A6S7HHZ9_PARCT|nr:Ankyrin repeat domain-containing 34B [Paramuricea clavata]
METKQVNKFGRSYSQGVALDQDLKCLIVDSIIKEGGDRATGYIPCTFAKLSRRFCVSSKAIKSVWHRFCEEMTTTPKKKGGMTHSKLEEGDLELIEVLKVHSPSISLSEIIQELPALEISMSAISRAIRNRLPSGEQYTRKKLTRLARERFTPENMFYTQLFINYLSSKDPYRLKFFDEAGIKIPCVGTRTYGHSAKGTRSVEVVRKHESPNKTLNMLVSLDGPVYHNIVNGGTNTAPFSYVF